MGKIVSRTTFAAKNWNFLQTIDLIEVTITDSETGFNEKKPSLLRIFNLSNK